MKFNSNNRLIDKVGVLTKVSKQTNLSLTTVRNIIYYFEEYTQDQVINDLQKPFVIPFIGKIKRKNKFIQQYLRYDD